MMPLETEAWITVAGLGAPAMAAAGFDVSGWMAAMLASPAVAAPDGYAPDPFDAGVAGSTIVGRRASWCIGQLSSKQAKGMAPLLVPESPALCGAVVDALLHWLAVQTCVDADLAVMCTAAISLRQVVAEPGVVAALAANDGKRADEAVRKLLELTVAADGPTRKWQAVDVVMQLVTMGAVAGTVADSSLAQIVAAWDASRQEEGPQELLQVRTQAPPLPPHQNVIKRAALRDCVRL